MIRWRWATGLLAIGAGCRLTGPVAPPSTATAFASSPPVPVLAVGLVTVEPPTNEQFWRMSRDPAAVRAGQAAFNASSCRTCHAVALTGGNGPNLADRQWLHGGTPREVFKTIANGVQSKGMPAWGPVLGGPMIADIVAFIFSHHHEGEPIELQAAHTPFVPVYD